MIYISFKNLPNNNLAYTPKVAPNMQRTAYILHGIKRLSAELLTSGEIFSVNRYECFTKNKNIIERFWNCKTNKRTTTTKKNHHQNFTGFYVKKAQTLDELKDPQNK